MDATIERKARRLADLMAMCPVIPVLTIEAAEDAVPLARALEAGGAPVLEVTLRTKVALDAVRRIVAEVEGVVVGAGTITAPADFAAAERAGAAFAVSPGATDRLLAAAAESALPFLPGVMTVSEAMRLAEHGYHRLKLFPADICGGPAFLSAIGAPLPGLRFCPTGGVGPANLGDYLRLANVACVGGSWLASRQLIAARDWEAVTRNAAEAVAVKRGLP